MATMWAKYPDLAARLVDVRNLILDQTVSADAGVQASIRSMVESNAKMLRPGLVLLAAGFGAPDSGKMTRIAAAVEMLHMASLIHDDIIDEAPLRRGLPTLAVRHGPRAAVLAGDALFARCFALIADYAEMEEVRRLSRVMPRMLESEMEQSGSRFTPNRSVRRYLRRITGKTALLISLSLFVGAKQSGCPDPLCFRLRRIGYAMGIGFQIIDDLLNMEGDGVKTGKPVGSDLFQGVYTLPAILALRADGDGKLTRMLSGTLNRQAAGKAAALIRERGGVEGARVAADLYTRRALRDINLLPDVPSRKMLREIAESLLTRQS